MSKIPHLSYRCEQTLRPQIQSLKKDSLVTVFDYLFPQSGNEQRFSESIVIK